MRIIPMYLPQFHRLPENDAWWGEGFTEWTAVKAAEPLFENHVQPKIPLDGFYYDLLDKKTMEWQADLMNKYHIGGMCIYHYWFKDGRKILEKPAENLLRWKDINIPFCFSWANEAWTRTWSNVNWKNVWTSKFEPEHRDGESGILLEQYYGEEDAWREHFNYLLPFFRDSRYLRIGNRPIFIFYRPNSIPCLDRMIECWRKWSKEEGLEDLYLIGTNVNRTNSLDAILFQEPQYTILQCSDQKFSNKEGINIAKYLDGEKIWQHILERQDNTGEQLYYGGFSGYDDTPRRGSGGFLITKVSPEEFGDRMKYLIKKNYLAGSEFVFINAWNEWGEGMYLEPDEESGYSYLEAIKDAMENWENTDYINKSEKKADEGNAYEVINRYQSYWRILNSWLTLKEEGKTLENYFLKRNCSKIALYGVGMIGVHLIKELEGSTVKICYGIDQQGKENIHQTFPIYQKEDNLPIVDMIVVSVTHDFSNIFNELRKKVECPIISLEEIVEESRCI